MEQTQTQNFTVLVGRFWFQNRSLAQLPFIFILVFFTPEYVWTIPQSLFWAACILLAECIRLSAVGYVGSHTRTRSDEVPALFHAGPYRHFRNPLYVANILIYSFTMLLFGFVGAAAACFLYSCLEYYFIVSYEEDLLLSKFGTAYSDYCSKVPRWVPSFEPLYPTSGETFDLKKGLRSERSTLCLIAVLFILWAIKRMVL